MLVELHWEGSAPAACAAERNRPCADLRYWEKYNIGPSALNVADYAVATKNSLSEKC